MAEKYFCPECGHEFVQGEYNYNYDTALLDFECPFCDWSGTDNNVHTDKTIRVTDIEWDTDGENPEDLDLPSEVAINDDIDEDEIADWLSDNYGWCVLSFNVE